VPPPKPLITYPEELHKPLEDECLKMNARVMKHLMKGKMHKQKTFLQEKVMDQKGRQKPGASNVFMVK